MLCLPEFDTYHILEKYARDPDSSQNICALNALKKQARSRIHWRVLHSKFLSEDSLEGLLQLAMGRTPNKAKTSTQKKDLSQMSEEELMSFYNKAVSSVGLVVDPEALAKAQQQQ